jgi:hypothetical protein
MVGDNAPNTSQDVDVHGSPPLLKKDGISVLRLSDQLVHDNKALQKGYNNGLIRVHGSERTTLPFVPLILIQEDIVQLFHVQKSILEKV